MKRLSQEIIDSLKAQGCVIVCTVDARGFPHTACKGVLKINANGKVYLLDLYKGKTLHNLQKNDHMSITVLDEHRFSGYCLKGKASLLTESKLTPGLIKSWEDNITSRLTRRLLKNIKEEKSQGGHPEILLPTPKYVIALEVEEIVDLTPAQLQ